MDNDLTKIINDCGFFDINMELLNKYTRRVTSLEAADIQWNKVEHLHILGDPKPPIIGVRTEGLALGYYVGGDGTWVLAVRPSEAQVKELLSGCGSKLERLNIYRVGIILLDVSAMTGLKHLAYWAQGDCYLKGIRGCVDLEELELRNLVLKDVLDVSTLTKLRVLRLYAGKTSRECPVVGFQRLEELENLAIYGSFRESIVDVSRLHKLRALYLRENEALCDVQGIENLQKLERLAFGRTGIRKLPEGIRELKNLRHINLMHQTLDTLPDWIIELNLPFIRSSRGGKGIILFGTEIKDMADSILDQPQEMIVQWFEERKKGNKVPLNEIKIVFLGDGEAGKSHTIARLLNDGGDPIDYTDGATPGIVIKNKEYALDGRNIQVHFWDFGGQEILHSMHRIFLTERTLYVVLVNARDETQDARARYWLHNIKSFAPKAKVLLVLNKIDQNPNAKVNERDLKYKYENLSQVVSLSALEYDQARFNREFRDVLLEEIKQTGYLDATWPLPWTNVKGELEKMGTNYIRGPQYREICHNCSVDKNQKELLNWFTDLGISFCYSDDYRLENYVILRPDWITNALYIILFNKCRNARNGLIPHSSISWILSQEAAEQDTIRRVLPSVYYDWDEIRYVLEVFHKAQLSFDAGDQNEFIPMLCDPNSSPIAQQYEEDSGTLEFQMKFDYLPSNLLYQLMVDRKHELQMDHVWRTGALFAQNETGFSAVIAIDGDRLRIFVRSTDDMHKPNTYLTMLKANVDRIWKRMGLKRPDNTVVYKLDGRQDLFDYDRLKDMLHNGVSQEYSSVWRRLLDIQHILNQAAPEGLEEQNKLLDCILKSCQNIQGDMRYVGSDEDDRNTRMRDDLELIGYIVRDQTRQGSSSSGLNPGELDIQVYSERGRPWTIIEALRVNSGTKAEWNKHLEKLLENYNSHGAPFLFLVTYVDDDSNKFNRIWGGYQTHIKKHNTDKFQCVPESFELPTHPRCANNQYIKLAKCQYVCDGYSPTVYHIFVRIGQ